MSRWCDIEWLGLERGLPIYAGSAQVRVRSSNHPEQPAKPPDKTRLATILQPHGAPLAANG